MNRAVEARQPKPAHESIQPIPVKHRVLSGFDLAVLWGDLGIGLLVLVTGALLVPGLGFASAMVAIVLGSIVSVGLLALAGSAGARYGMPTMVLFRPMLGIRGSWVPSALNALQLVGWTAVELWAMSYVASIVTEREFGFSGRLLWLLVAGVVCTGLALWGPVGVTRIWLKKFGAWVIVGISVTVTVLLFTSSDLSSATAQPGDGSLQFGSALDLVIAMPVSWLPLVADYTRFGRRPGSALFGTFAGYFVANVWLYALGAALVLGADAHASPGGIAAGVLAIFGGSVAGVLFLVGLLAGETDEAFANIYSGSLSLANVWPRVPQWAFISGIVAVAVSLAAWLTMERYEGFLFLIGSVFVPLFGVLIADHFVNRRGAIDVSQLYRQRSDYWYTGGVRLGSFVPWLAGFALYHWITPTGPVWWVSLVEMNLGAPPSWLAAWGASIPAFATALVLALRTKHRSKIPPA
ncbi:putative hydroxymethylpyrimidine transporter CytX [soil metagenome]